MSNQAIAVVSARFAEPVTLAELNVSSPDRDAVFDRWLAEGLVWLPERGIGYFPVQTGTEPYDAAYFDKYTAYRGSEAFGRLNAARVDLVHRHAGPHAVVCDVGIGDGAFIEARGDALGFTLGYDVNPAGVDWLKRRGSWLDPYVTPVEALTFWDCLEHIHDPAPLLASAIRWVFVSIPIVPGDGPPRSDWKHLRKDEHCWYFSRKGLIAWMAEHGFECIEVNANETLAGREDVEAFAFRRI